MLPYRCVTPYSFCQQLKLQIFGFHSPGKSKFGDNTTTIAATYYSCLQHYINTRSLLDLTEVLPLHLKVEQEVIFSQNCRLQLQTDPDSEFTNISQILPKIKINHFHLTSEPNNLVINTTYKLPPSPPSILMYTDASKNDSSFEATFAFYNKNNLTHTAKFKLHNNIKSVFEQNKQPLKKH